MAQAIFKQRITWVALATAALVAACGGGGSSSSTTDLGGSTGTCTAAPCINFAETSVTLTNFGGLESEVVNDPANASNKVLKLTKDAGDETWAGVTVVSGASASSTSLSKTLRQVFGPAAPASTEVIDPSKGITLRVYSAAVGVPVMVKIENASNDQVFAEATALSTKANQWETLTFTYGSASTSATYNKISVFPAFDQKVAAVVHIDELKYSTKTVTPEEPTNNLITNGDFSNVSTGWSGNAANVVTENGSSYNFADVTTAGNAWDVNLSYVLNIPTSGVNYKLTFKASSNRSRALKAGIGLNGDPWTNTVQDLTLTTTPQTFVLNLTSNFSGANSRIIFDMGHDTGHVVIDDVVLEIVEGTPTPVGGPSTAAPVPTALATNVSSVFSDTYTSVSGVSWGPDWGPSSARIVDATIGGNNTKYINVAAGQTFAGISFPASAINATNHTHFNMHYWIDTPLLAGQVLSIKLSNHDLAGGASGESSAIETTVTNVTGGAWQTLSIPLSSFSIAGGGSASRNKIAEVIITAARADSAQPVKVYFDNIYFSTTAP